MSLILMVLLGCAAFAAIFALPYVIALVAYMAPIVLAIVAALYIYNWLT